MDKRTGYTKYDCWPRANASTPIAVSQRHGRDGAAGRRRGASAHGRTADCAPAEMQNAVVACGIGKKDGAALEELTHERVPLDWATTQNNLDRVQALLAERKM